MRSELKKRWAEDREYYYIWIKRQGEKRPCLFENFGMHETAFT